MSVTVLMGTRPDPPVDGDVQASAGGRVESADAVRPAGPTFLFTGGGTGGHIYPGLAVAAELRALRPDARFIWVGTPDRLEARIVPAAGIPLEPIRVSYLKGRGLWGKLRALLRLPGALWQSRRVLRRHRPDVVIGVGGFASGPVALVAALKRIPMTILEQNARPGLTNRLLGRVARRVFVSFDETRRWFAERKVRLRGNPIRSDLIERASGESELDSATVRLLVFGGSQGAASLNNHLPAVLQRVHQAGVALTVRHAAGRGRRAEVVAAYGGAPFVEIVEYIDDMAAAYAWADFVICRAGASTVAELTAVGKPALYVPFPAAADNHQERNARAVEERGGGLVLLDVDLRADPPGERLVETLLELLGDRPRMREMGRRARRMGRPEAARRIAEDILSLVEAP